MKRMIGKCALLTLAVLLPLIGAVRNEPRANAAPPLAPFETLTIPMVRYNGKNGNSVYAAQPKYKNLFDKASGNWEKFGTVGHVYPQKVAGTVPLLSLRRKASVGIAPYYFYTTSIDEALAKQSTGWVMVPEYKGVAGYVATSSKPGTIPVYLYRQPTGPGFLYAFGEQENNALKNSTAQYQKIAFYVWAEPVESESPKGAGFPDPKSTLDLSMRPNLYFTGKYAATINTAGIYGSSSAPITLKKSQGNNCNGNTCSYNLGFFLKRSIDAGGLSVYAQYVSSAFGIIGNTIVFKAGQKVREVIFPVELPVGQHEIKVGIDPTNKIPELNEGNNSFTVKVNIVP